MIIFFGDFLSIRDGMGNQWGFSIFLIINTIDDGEWKNRRPNPNP